MMLARSSARDVGLIELQPLCPFRPLDWRWRTGLCLSTGGLRSRRKWIDGWVRRAANYLRLVDRLRGRDAHRLVARDPELAGASRLRYDADRERDRLLVEAWLLTGECAITVAMRYDLDPGVVAAYEALYFDVRARLSSPDHILFTALAPLFQSGPSGPDRDTLIKLLAYTGGPYVLEAVLRALDETSARARQAPDSSPALDRQIRLLISALSIPVDETTSAGLLKIHQILDGIERRRARDQADRITQPIVPSALVVAPAPSSAALGPPGIPSVSCAPTAPPDPILTSDGAPAARVPLAPGVPSSVSRPRCTA